MVRSLHQTSQFNFWIMSANIINTLMPITVSKLIAAAWTGSRMSPNDSTITEMEIELPHQHSTATDMCCATIWARGRTGLWLWVRVWRAQSLFIYPQLSISISTVPAHFQASSGETPALGKSNPSLPLTFGSNRSCFVISNMESARVRRSIVQGSAALHAAQLRDDWEESWLSMINLPRF